MKKKWDKIFQAQFKRGFTQPLKVSIDLNHRIRRASGQWRVRSPTSFSWILDLVFLVWLWSSRSSDLGPYCFIGLFGRDAHDAARRACRTKLLGLFALVRQQNIVLKALFFFISFFFVLWSILASQMAPKMDQKHVKITSQIDLDFNRIFQRFFNCFLKG